MAGDNGGSPCHSRAQERAANSKWGMLILQALPHIFREGARKYWRPSPHLFSHTIPNTSYIPHTRDLSCEHSGPCLNPITTPFWPHQTRELQGPKGGGELWCGHTPLAPRCGMSTGEHRLLRLKSLLPISTFRASDW